MAALALSGMLLSGCAETTFFSHMAKTAVGSEAGPPPGGTAVPTYKVGKPYQVSGVWYYPAEDFGYDETGIASWYGPDFHAKQTANGEIFDQNEVSAAHKTLPMPSIVRVTNLENGRQLVLRVNDRGPFVNGRIIDLSRRAAQLLGIEGKGTAKVRVQILPDESRVLAGKLKQETPPNEPKLAAAAPRATVSAETLPPPSGVRVAEKPAAAVAVATAQPARQRLTPDAVEGEVAKHEVKTVPVAATQLFVQAGSFGRHDNALRLSARLSSVGNPQIQQTSVQGRTVYRVRLGPLASVEEADRMLDAVIGIGQQDARVVVD
jgi:rare lipoprotein A